MFINIRPTQAVINLKAFAHNIQLFKKLIGSNVLLMAVVKANAYGHGILPIAKTGIASGADWLGVALVEEGIKLREAGIRSPILVLGTVAPEDAHQMVQKKIAATVARQESALALNQAAETNGLKATIHIKVDTGMGRIGLKPRDVLPFVKKLASLKSLNIEGIFSHFASADEKDKTFSYNQINIFKNVIASLDAKGIIIPLKHLAGSAATVGLPESYFNMVRLGISLYGVYPSAEVNQSIELQQVMTLKTEIAFIKDMPKGAPISYGRAFVTKRRSRIATLPIGYADGYPRLISNHGETLVCGKRAPVVGRVCMDMTMIDITEIPGAQVGSEVILFGKQNDTEIPVEEIAKKARTISHEIMCGISKRVPRQYL